MNSKRLGISQTIHSSGSHEFLWNKWESSLYVVYWFFPKLSLKIIKMCVGQREQHVIALVSIIIPKVAELMQMCLDVFCHVMLCVSMCNIYASQKARVNCEGVTCRFIGDIFVANLHLSAISQPWDDFIFYELFLFGRLIGFNAFFPLTRLFFSSSLNE